MSDLAAANDAMVAGFVSAWERRDTASIVDAFAEDAVYHAMPLSPITGKAALREWVSSFEGKPPGHLDVRNQVAGDRVVINERVDRITINGREITLPICAVFEIRDGHIAAWREYFDLAVVAAAYNQT